MRIFVCFFFQENLGDFSKEHGERFHQDIESMEWRWKGRSDSAMMGDCIWSLVREDKSGHKRKARSTVSFWNTLTAQNKCVICF